MILGSNSVGTSRLAIAFTATAVLPRYLAGVLREDHRHERTRSARDGILQADDEERA